MVTVDWKGQMVFEATPPTGYKFVIDAHPESGGTNQGPTPVEALLGAIASCSAMDVISILQKKRQDVESYRIEVDGVRGPQGVYPRPFTSLTIRHILRGKNLDEAAVQRAVELSDAKYCTVITTLRERPEIKSLWLIEETTGGRA